MVRSVFHLTLRAAEGFLRSLFHLLEWELPVPDYTTLCKRAKRLGVSLHRKAAGPLHLVLDSTGLKVFGEGEWKVRQHGYTKRRTWRKLHLSVDSETQEIQAVVLSEASLDDAGAVPGPSGTRAPSQWSRWVAMGPTTKGRYMRAALPEVSGG